MGVCFLQGGTGGVVAGEEVQTVDAAAAGGPTGWGSMPLEPLVVRIQIGRIAVCCTHLALSVHRHCCCFSRVELLRHRSMITTGPKKSSSPLLHPGERAMVADENDNTNTADINKLNDLLLEHLCTQYYYKLKLHRGLLAPGGIVLASVLLHCCF